MATVTYAVGQRLTAALLQSLADSTVNRPGLFLTQQAAQSIAHGTNTALTFGAGSEASFGTVSGWHSTVSNTSRVTPAAGYYRITGFYSSVAPAQPFTQLNCSIAVNGTRVTPQITTRPSTLSAVATNCLTTVSGIYLDGSAYVELFCQQQQSSGTAAVNTSVAAAFASYLEVVFDRPF